MFKQRHNIPPTVLVLSFILQLGIVFVSSLLCLIDPRFAKHLSEFARYNCACCEIVNMCVYETERERKRDKICQYICMYVCVYVKQWICVWNRNMCVWERERDERRRSLRRFENRGIQKMKIKIKRYLFGMKSTFPYITWRFIFQIFDFFIIILFLLLKLQSEWVWVHLCVFFSLPLC